MHALLPPPQDNIREKKTRTHPPYYTAVTVQLDNSTTHTTDSLREGRLQQQLADLSTLLSMHMQRTILALRRQERVLVVFFLLTQGN